MFPLFSLREIIIFELSHYKAYNLPKQLKQQPNS